MILLNLKKYIAKVYTLVTLLFVGCIISAPFVSSIGLALFIIGSFVFILIKKDIPKFNWQVLLFSVPFLIYLISIRDDYGYNEPLEVLIKSLPIIVLPVLFTLTHSYLPSYKKIAYYYTIGLIITCSISLIIGLYFFILNEYDINFITYYPLAEYMSLHPTYLSLYILVGIIFIFRFNVFSKVYSILLVLLFVTILLLLQARIALILLILLIGIKLLQGFGPKNVMYFSSLMILISFTILISPKIQNRLLELVELPSKEGLLIGNIEENGITQRVWLWSNSIDHVMLSPITGFGLTSQQTIFPWMIQKENLYHNNLLAYDKAAFLLSKYNLHNQYLQILYESGFLGLIIFITSAFYLIYLAFKHKKWLFLEVYAVVLIILSTENLLDRQMGIYFYSFILPLLFLSNFKSGYYDEI